MRDVVPLGVAAGRGAERSLLPHCRGRSLHTNPGRRLAEQSQDSRYRGSATLTRPSPSWVDSTLETWQAGRRSGASTLLPLAALVAAVVSIAEV